MFRPGITSLPLLAALAWSAPLLAQAPAGQPTSGVKSGGKPAPAQRKPAGSPAHKEIFCSNLRTGQLCPDSTAEILGLKGPQAEAWKVMVRKYNQGAGAAAEQLQKDSAAKLTPEQMEVLKAWFAVGWNEEINEILYKRNLDDLNKADTKDLSTKKPEEHDDH